MATPENGTNPRIVNIHSKNREPSTEERLSRVEEELDETRHQLTEALRSIRYLTNKIECATRRKRTGDLKTGDLKSTDAGSAD